jgi:RNA polymerase sigma factor (sigma-70 family)
MSNQCVKKRRESSFSKGYIVNNEDALVMIDSWHKADSKRKQRLSNRIIFSLGFLIHARIRPYRGSSIYDDLLQEGKIGLFRALNDFDLERSNNFFKFATCHIKTRVRRFLVREFKRQRREVLFKEPELIIDDEETVVSTEELFERKQEGQLFTRALAFLSSRERDLLLMRFGLDGYCPCNLQEIGEKMNLTRERVRQIQVKALKKLKRSSNMMNFE